MDIKISIEIDGKKYSLEEARELHKQLGELLREKETIRFVPSEPLPIQPIQPVLPPPWPYKPYWLEQEWSPMTSPFIVTCSNGSTFHESDRCVRTEVDIPMSKNRFSEILDRCC